MYVDCKFAFNSEQEKQEWHNLSAKLDFSSNLPLEYTINCSENIQRLERHGYVVTLSCAPNVYEIKKRN